LGEKIIEVTVVSDGVTGQGRKRMLGIAHVVSIAKGAHETSVIELTTGKKIHVKETYDELKRLVGA
jgi:hypothetical protein